MDARPPEYENIHGLRGTPIATLVSELNDLMTAQKDLEQEINDRKKQVLDLMEAAKTKSAFVGATRVTVTARESKRLDIAKLQKLGVPLATIDASWVVTPGKPFLKLTTNGEAE
jgi:hypothetical protein